MAQNVTQEKELTPGQMKAIASLLSGLDALAVCKEAGCSIRTLHRWKADPAFVAALRAARLAALESATAKLRNRASEAVDTLHELLSCDRPAVRARAAEAILTHAYRAAEVEDLSERLAAIEARLSQTEGASKP